MSTGGIFTIITNDGKQDKMLMATELLSNRLARIYTLKQQANPQLPSAHADLLPTLVDIEKTHILFTNAHFKPFAAIGFEYNKVTPTSGNLAWGQTAQFSIPQFGDFFHDIAVHVELDAPVINYTNTLPEDKPAFRWCNFPGERMFQKVEQSVNGNPLDSYTAVSTLMHRNFRVSPNKMSAWRRCVGQEDRETGYVAQRNWVGSGSALEGTRVAADVYRGPQTPGDARGLEMFIPLLFWYNTDVRLAVPSVAIPYGQRFINIELAPSSLMCGLVARGLSATPQGTLVAPAIRTIEMYINNIFMNPEVHKIYIKRVGFSLIRVHKEQIITVSAGKSSDNILLSALKWPIEYLLVSATLDEYQNAQNTDVGKWLHVWDECAALNEAKSAVKSGANETRVVNLVRNDGVSTLGVTVTTGVLAGTGVTTTDVRVGDRLVFGSVSVVAHVVALSNTVAGVLPAGSAVTNITSSYIVAVAPSTAVAAATLQHTTVPVSVVAPSFENIIDEIFIEAHGVPLHRQGTFEFFSNYTNYHFGGLSFNAPQNGRIALVPFCLYPGTYQPSGHINVSRAREFYLRYTSTWISANPSKTVRINVVASAVNFLLISDGSAVLRYST